MSEQDEGALYAETGELRRATFDALRRGERPTAATLATRLGQDVGPVEDLLRGLDQADIVRLDGERRVFAVAGLSAEPTAHRLTLEGVPLFTWCAIDAVGIPAALGVDAEIVTTCWQCGAAIKLSLGRGHPPTDRPERLWQPDGPCAKPREEFCPFANLFCTADHLERWRAGAGDPPGRPLDLFEAADFGRDHWAAYRGGSPREGHIPRRGNVLDL